MFFCLYPVKYRHVRGHMTFISTNSPVGQRAFIPGLCFTRTQRLAHIIHLHSQQRPSVTARPEGRLRYAVNRESRFKVIWPTL